MTRPPLSHRPAINALPREKERKTADDMCRSGCPLPYPLRERTLCYLCCQYRTGDEQVMLLPAPDRERLGEPQPIGKTVSDLVTALASRGITLRLADDGCTLLARPREAMTPDVAAAIKAHKLSLIVRYKAAQPLPPESWALGLAETLTEDYEHAVTAWYSRDRDAAMATDERLRPELKAATEAQNMKALRSVVNAMDAAYMVFWEEYLPLVETDTPAQIWARTPDVGLMGDMT